MGFDLAIDFLKQGRKLKRSGWNGKDQHIELGFVNECVSSNGKEFDVMHENIGNRVVVFVGTQGVQVGWLASQADMLAEDWEFAD